MNTICFSGNYPESYGNPMMLEQIFKPKYGADSLLKSK